MMTCEYLRAQLLGYLYDLLDDDDKQAADAHLATCEGCQAALAAARRQQRLLAAAAKSAFPNVQFERPKSTPVETVQTPKEKKRFPTRFHFALAATFLLAAGLGLPGLWYGWTGHKLQSNLHEEQLARNEANARLSLAMEQRRASQEKFNSAMANTGQAVVALQQDEKRKWEDLRRRVAEQQLQISIVGPEALQAGADNDYIVRMRNLQNEPLKAELSAKLVDQAGRVFFEVKDIPTLGDHHLHLPADLPITPDRELSLDLVARKDGQPDRTLHQKISLATPVYLTHLATDKPMYRPGETVHYRSLTLERFSLKPVEAELNLQFSVHAPKGDEVFKQSGAARLRKADGKLVAMPDGKPVTGVGAGEYLLPVGLVGGEYTLKVSETNNRFPEQERKFIVNNFANPRLNKELDFTRKSYGPGQEVVAACSAMRAEGGPVANRPVLASMFIDGKPYGPDGKAGAKTLALQTDALGKVNVRFKLPEVIERGQASLTVQFDDGGNVEPLVRTIPIALKKLQVEFFPEGGDLIAGGANRVYFQARTTLDKPAELKGHIVDDQGKTVVPLVATLHDDTKPGVNQGMGQFAITPTAGRKYQLKIDEPAGMEGTYTLPDVHEDGIVLQVGQPNKEALPVQVTSMGKDRNLLIGVYCRGRLLDSQSVVARKNVSTNVETKPALPAGGVFRVTVFEEMPRGSATRLLPRAERLVYREPANALTLAAKLDQERYIPGQRAKVSLSSKAVGKEATPTVAMAAVVDKSVLTLADEKTFHGMPTHYYLCSEIRHPEDLEFADFLVSADPKAPEALDLLLGTQGWRRFAEQNPEEYRKKHKEDADRLLLVTGPTVPVEVDMARQEAQRLREGYASRLGELESDRKQAERSLAELQNPGNPLETSVREAAQAVESANVAVQAAERASKEHEELLARNDKVAGLMVLAFLLVLGALTIGFVQGTTRIRILAGIAAAVLVVSVFTAGPSLQRSRGIFRKNANVAVFGGVGHKLEVLNEVAPDMPAQAGAEMAQGRRMMREDEFAAQPQDKQPPANGQMRNAAMLKAAPKGGKPPAGPDPAPAANPAGFELLRGPPLAQRAAASAPAAPTAPAGAAATGLADGVDRQKSLPLTPAKGAIPGLDKANKEGDQKLDAAVVPPPRPMGTLSREDLSKSKAAANEAKDAYKQVAPQQDHEQRLGTTPLAAETLEKKSEKQAKAAVNRSVKERAEPGPMFGKPQASPPPPAAEPASAANQPRARGAAIGGFGSGRGGKRAGMGAGGGAGPGAMPPADQLKGGAALGMGGGAPFGRGNFDFNVPPIQTSSGTHASSGIRPRSTSGTVRGRARRFCRHGVLASRSRLARRQRRVRVPARRRRYELPVAGVCPHSRRQPGQLHESV